MRVFKIVNLRQIIPVEIDITRIDKEIIKLLLKRENTTAVDILKGLKNQGLIKSIWRPKNKKLSSLLKELVYAKKVNKQAIDILR